jgi:hypothetical protein
MYDTNTLGWFLALPKSVRERHLKTAKLLVRERLSANLAEAMTIIYDRRDDLGYMRPLRKVA